MRIIWNSDKIMGGHGAYSKVTFECCTRLARRGLDVAHIPMGRANKMGSHTYHDVLIYPSGRNPWNEDVAVQDYLDFNADLMVVLKDIWVLSRLHKEAIMLVPYVPVDHAPVSPMVTSKLHTALMTLTPSRHGKRELEQAGVDHVRYLPHGVRTDLYRPMPEEKQECKRLWGIEPDAFTVLFVGKNQSRKMIPHVARAVKLFIDNNPDVKIRFFLWTDFQPSEVEKSYEGAVGHGTGGAGVNLLPELMRIGLGPNLVLPDKELIKSGVPEHSESGWDMNKLYNASDVVISLSGEGFWLPGVEAQACGKPVVVADYASAPEVCGVGYKVPMVDWVVMNSPGTRYPVCDLDRAAEALEKILNRDEAEMRRKARSFAMRYDWNAVMEKYMKPFILEARNQLYPKITSEGVTSWAS